VIGAKCLKGNAEPCDHDSHDRTRRIDHCQFAGKAGTAQQAILVAVAIALLSIHRASADEPQQESSKRAALTCSGWVRDALYGKPLAGAKVTIWILAKPETAEDQTVNSVGRIESVTDAEGKYTYQLATDHLFVPPDSNRSGTRELPFIPLEIEASASGYATARTEGKVYPLTASTLESSQQSAPGEGFTFPVEKPTHPPLSYISTINILELRPAKEVTGLLQSTDGKPVTGAKIIAHSQIPLNERKLTSTPDGNRPDFSGSAREVQVSDAQGRFRVTMITPGEGMLMIFPTDRSNACQLPMRHWTPSRCLFVHSRRRRRYAGRSSEILASARKHFDRFTTRSAPRLSKNGIAPRFGKVSKRWA
jgi:hypothetical protein